MFVIEKMKIHRLEVKPIVSNRALYLQSGASPSKVESQNTAECVNDPIPYGARKTQLLHLGQLMTKAHNELQSSAGTSGHLDVNANKL